MPYGQKRVPIGQRREQITVRRAVTTDDGMGGQTVTRTKTVAEPWAAVEALDERTKEILYGQQMTARHAYHIVVPYTTEIQVSDELIVRDKAMQIHTITDDEGLRRRLVLQVGEVQ